MNKLLFFLNLTVLTIADLVYEHYVITTRCNVTQEDDVIAAVRGTTSCGSICLETTDCSAFQYKKHYGSCRLFLESHIMESSPCSGSETGMTDLYVQQTLATTYNMTFFNYGNVTTNVSNSNVTSCQNGGHFDAVIGKCVCIEGWVGATCGNLTGDCSALQQTGEYTSHGIYSIHPSASPTSFKVYCFLTSTFGLTQIQAHLSSSYTFNLTWSDYKQGFTYDQLLTNSWLGNDYIHYLTNSRPLTLLLEMKNGSSNYQYRLHNFVMSSEEYNYNTTHDYYSTKPGGLPPCWPVTPPLPFSTHDRDNDGDPEVNCAALHGAGWWFESQNCTQCNLNGGIDPIEHIRYGDPSEAFVLPVDPDFNPQYVLMALYWLP